MDLNLMAEMPSREEDQMFGNRDSERRGDGHVKTEAETKGDATISQGQCSRHRSWGRHEENPS